MNNSLSLGFALGMIAGEGSWPLCDPRQTTSQSNLEVLHSMQSIVGGVIYGPYTYPRSDGHAERVTKWILAVSGAELALLCLATEMHMPPSQKLRQYREWWNVHSAQVIKSRFRATAPRQSTISKGMQCSDMLARWRKVSTSRNGYTLQQMKGDRAGFMLAEVSAIASPVMSEFIPVMVDRWGLKI